MKIAVVAAKIVYKNAMSLSPSFSRSVFSFWWRKLAYHLIQVEGWLYILRFTYLESRIALFVIADSPIDIIISSAIIAGFFNYFGL